MKTWLTQSVLRITLLYILLYSLVIFITPYILDALLVGPEQHIQLEALAEWVFAAVSGVVLYALLLLRRQGESERKQAVARYRLLFDTMLDGFALHEIICNEAGKPVDYRFLEINPAFERLTGLRAADLIGKTVLETMPDTESVWIERYGAVALTKKQ